MNSELEQRFSALQAVATLRSFTAGQILFHKGEPATAIFSMVSGRVKLIRYLADGSQVTQQRL